MLDYVVRSVQRSPQMMREPGDACSFLRQLGQHACFQIFGGVAREAMVRVLTHR